MHPLRKARLDADLTAEVLAKRAGINYRTLLKAEYGRGVSDLTVWRIARVLERDPEELSELLRAHSLTNSNEASDSSAVVAS